MRQGARTRQPLSFPARLRPGLGCLGDVCGSVRACACVCTHVHVVGRGSRISAGVPSRPMKGWGYLVGPGQGKCPAELPPPVVTPEGGIWVWVNRYGSGWGREGVPGIPQAGEKGDFVA